MYYTTLAELLPFFEEDLSNMVGPSLSQAKVSSFDAIGDTDGLAIGASLGLQDGIVFDLPGIPGFQFVVSQNGTGEEGGFWLNLYPSFEISISGVNLGIRFPSTLLKPVQRRSDGVFQPVQAGGEQNTSLELLIENTGFSLNSNAQVEFLFPSDYVELEIDQPFMIGDSGVVIDVNSIEFTTSPYFGVTISEAAVHLPGGLSKKLGVNELKLENACIDGNGFSGEISSTWENDEKDTGFFGNRLKLKKVALEFKQNALISSEITGTLTLPFFEKEVDVEIGFDLNGNITLGVKVGLEEDLEIEDILKMTVEDVGFELRNGVFTTSLGGELTPLVGTNEGLDWPSFKIKQMTIDSEGNINIDGGWLDIPEQKAFSFYGFQMEITKIGFGSEEEGTRWIGLSGGVKLVDGLPMGASVEGLRISWKGEDWDITFDGIGVEFEVPDVLRFDGEVSYLRAESKFSGAIKLELLSLGLALDAALVIGKNKEHPSYSYFYIYVDTQLPVGIPLFSSGLALYGFAGLFANKMQPKLASHEDQDWYGWYKSEPAYCVTDPNTKWEPNPDAIAIGAGVTIGTLVDNGYLFSSRAMLVIEFSGPTIILAARAQILSERAELTSKTDPPFRALAVIDGRTGTFLFNVEASYRLPSNSGLIFDLHAGAEVFFAGYDDWHFNLGEKEPRDKRIAAEIFNLFEANSYFMLNPRRVETGSYLGIDERWKFGPLKASLEAWIEGGALISWKPVHFGGLLGLHGGFDVSVFGFGFGLGAVAEIEAQTPTPYLLLIALSIEIDLPWFLPDFDIPIELKWEEKSEPPIPLPLKECAVAHLKVTDTWSAPKLPVLDTNENKGFLKDGLDPSTTPTVIDEKGILNSIPLVPMDSRPVLSFDRSVHDLVGLGSAPGNALPSAPDREAVGDYDYRYELIALGLEKWLGDGDPSWTPIVIAGSIVGKPEDHNDGTCTVTTRNFLSEDLPTNAFRGGVLQVVIAKNDTKEIISYPILSHSSGQGFTVAVEHLDEKDHLEDGQSFSLIMKGHQMPLYGQWQAAGDDKPRATKLMLWSRNSYDYLRAMTHVLPPEYDDPDYANHPCYPVDELVLTCIDFDKLPVGTSFPRNYPYRGLIFAFEHQPEVVYLDEVPDAVCHASLTPYHTSLGTDVRHAVSLQRFEPEFGGAVCSTFRVIFPEPVKAAVLWLQAHEAEAWAYNNGTLVQGISVQEMEYDYQIVQIDAEAIDEIKITATTDGCCPMLIKLCYLTVATLASRGETEALNERVHQETIRWEGAGHVFEPDTYYRLQIVTQICSVPKGQSEWNPPKRIIEYGYFHVGGPPGLIDVKAQAQDSIDREHPLNDLALYVTSPGRTIPCKEIDQADNTPTSQSEPPRCVYRGYDVGIEFNEDYVELMYRLAGHDLALYVYDSNEQPIRDVQGRLLVLPNLWDTGDDRKARLSKTDYHFLRKIADAACASIDSKKIRLPQTLVTGQPAQVLKPETLYEVRAIPLLLHDDCRAGEFLDTTRR
jgi:hypothetical protein